jgi:acyl-CoA thioester hydrolase
VSFALQVTALPSDIDELDHVSNVVYVRWVQEVAVAHSAAKGWSFARYSEHGAIFVVRRHEIDYLAPVLVDEVVRLETWIESWRAASCVRRTEVFRCRDNAMVARSSTQWAFVSFADGRPQRIPEEILDAMKADHPGARPT